MPAAPSRAGTSGARDEQQYGFEADGNIVVVREYVSPGSFREELRVPRGESVMGYRWSETGAALVVNIARYAAGRMRTYPPAAISTTPARATTTPIRCTPCTRSPSSSAASMTVVTGYSELATATLDSSPIVDA